jgi:hypothetical protein
MKQRGRESAASLSTVVAQFPIRLPDPPDDFSDEQVAVWRSIIAEHPIDWLDSGSKPLFAAFCRASVESKRIGDLITSNAADWLKDDEGLCRYKELRKIQAQLSAELTSLATKLRLTQQSRYRADAAGARSKPGAPGRPWNPVIQSA